VCLFAVDLTMSNTRKEMLKLLTLISLKVFNPAEDGTIKVILSTNIAESSVTIDDVLAVIDGGLVRELSYDAESAMSMMDTVAVSKESATQRLGRAGRVAPGVCYRLYSRGFHEAMPGRSTPEMQRTALETTCLQTSTISNEIEGFLSQAMDPPPAESVLLAVDRLSKLGALEIIESSNGNCEILTPLGRVLSRLPVDPSTGRMLIMGVVMKCLDPVLTAAALFSSRSVFYNPPGLRDEAQQIRRSFSSDSDTTAKIYCYNRFWNKVVYESWDDACLWAKEHYVSIAAMISIKNVRQQLLNEMKKLGLIESEDMYKISFKEYALKADSSLNANSKNELLHNAVLASSIPGNISSRRRLSNFGTLRTRMEGHAELHPSSVSFFRKPPRDVNLPTWYLYRDMVLSSQVFLREL
jgi:HrpA-like RNA helicase